jgi:DNA-binding PadR family transcriptional regulator
MPDPNWLSSILPLREPTFFILLALAPGLNNRSAGKHGYAILQEVESLSGGKVRLSTGTLYEALARLLEQGLVERLEDSSSNSGERSHPGKPRKVYRLSRSGWRVLEAETQRMEALVTAANLRLKEQS